MNKLKTRYKFLVLISPYKDKKIKEVYMLSTCRIVTIHCCPCAAGVVFWNQSLLAWRVAGPCLSCAASVCMLLTLFLSVFLRSQYLETPVCAAPWSRWPSLGVPTWSPMSPLCPSKSVSLRHSHPWSLENWNDEAVLSFYRVFRCCGI